MNEILVKVEKIDPAAKLPRKGNDDPKNAGYDLYAIEDAEIKPLERKLLRTGIKMEIPDGYYGRIAPRSGLALKNGIDVLAGVIDSNYRNEVGVVLINFEARSWLANLLKTLHISTQLFGEEGTFKIKAGDRIAQIIFEKCYNADITEGKLDETARVGGFGSTGK